jgi:hypothetical protein
MTDDAQLREQTRSTIVSEKRKDNRVSLVLWMVSADQILSPWWSETRDRQLRAFWKKVDPLAGAVYALVSKMATIPFKIVPKDYAVQAHHDQAERFAAMIQYGSEFGQGWEVFFSKWIQDLLTQDKGAFAEILGDGDPVGPIQGMPYGINHLDAARCVRTSNPEFPVVYYDSDKAFRLHYTRVAFASIQPSPNVDMNGTGFCALSKAVNVAQSLYDVLVYKQEKLGSRPTRSILLGKGGLDADDIAEAFAMANETMDNRLLSQFSQNVVIGDASHPDAELDMIDLASLPDGFDYQTDMMIGMALIALAFGVDARELFPMMGVGATRADALVQHLKARTKGIGHLLTIAENTFSPKLLPPTLEWQFDYTDDAQDRQVAEIRKIRSERWDIDLKNYATDERTVREQMVESGDLSTEQFERLELKDGRLEDGTPLLSLFYDPEFKSILDLTIPNPLDVANNDPELIKPVISQKRDELIQGLGMVKNYRQRRMINQALFALDYLESQYESVKMASIRETATTDTTASEGETPNAPESPNESSEEIDGTDSSIDDNEV